MENKNFDQFIKQSLGNLDGADHVPMDWSSLEGKIDADIDLNADVEANSFDQSIEQSLGNLDGHQYAPMDWSLMENKLDAELGTPDSEFDPQLEDIYLDGVAYEHLNDLETPYNKDHWEIMSARLDEEYAYRRKVIITKALEAIVVLLLVWTAINQPIKKLKESSSPLPIATIPTSPNNTNNLNEAAILPQSTSSENLLADNTLTADAVSNSKNKTKNNSEHSSIIEESNIVTEGISSETINSNNLIPSTNSTSISYLKNQKIALVESENREEIIPLTQLSSSNNLLKENKESTRNHSIINGITPLASLVPELLSLDNPESDLLAGLKNKQKVRKTELSFSMFSSVDYNFIQSDFFNTSIKDWDVYQRDRNGYSGGFSIGFQVKRFLIETGASYSYISYNQREESNIIGNFTDGYLEEQWADAELDMVQIPLNIQYAFLMKNKWRMYSLTGISLNTAVKNNFNFQIEEQTESSRSPIENSKIATESASYKGLFEGGSLRNSSYLAANLGLGIERKFTYRWSLYLQPVYRHYFTFESVGLDGFGPQNDRIHSGSILFGAKVKIR